MTHTSMEAAGICQLGYLQPYLRMKRALGIASLCVLPTTLVAACGGNEFEGCQANRTCEELEESAGAAGAPSAAASESVASDGVAGGTDSGGNGNGGNGSDGISDGGSGNASESLAGAAGQPEGADCAAGKDVDSCEPGDDANCNGIPNEGCACLPGEMRPCTEAGLLGTCADGVQVCNEDDDWGACSTLPTDTDTCEPGNDDNCNGVANEACLCINGVTTQECGACDNGTRVCSDGKANQFGACMGASGVPTSYFRDRDGDGYGSAATISICGDPPAGYVDTTGDCCDDASDLELAAQINPGQTNNFPEPAGICGIEWDYNCSGEVEFPRAGHIDGCADAASYPTCEASVRPYTPADCGVVFPHCGCPGVVPNGVGYCMSVCNGATPLGCR